jgi:endonuclease/exonuclease/phosphatase family metal-dependent hydrolase
MLPVMKSLTFLQWNILYTEKPSNIIQLLKELQPDIIALQELTSGFDIHGGEDIPKSIANSLGYNYYAKLSTGSSNTSKEKFGSGIFTRFPVINQDFKWINEYNPSVAQGYDNEYKAYVEITVKIDDQVLTVGTTHMSYTHRFINYPRKRQEADRLVKILESKKDSYIFSGDLNSRPGSYTIKSIGRRLKHAGPKYEDKTWTTKPFSYRGFEETDLNWRLDYVFTSKDIKVISAEVVDTPYSDHLPILTNFVLK